MMFDDRHAAGLALARELDDLAGRDPLVLALPRGGVPVAAAVADALGAQLDMVLVRKLGLPGRPELAMGAIGEGGVRVLNDVVVHRAGVSPRSLAEVERHEAAELDRRGRLWRRRAAIPREGRLALIVDDGVATGATAAAACAVTRAQGASAIVVAAPVVSPEAKERLGSTGVEVRTCVTADLAGVGAAYRDFHQLSDEEVSQFFR